MLNFIRNTVNLYTTMQIHVQCTVISTYIYTIYMCAKYLEPVCPLIWNFRTPKEGPDGCILKVRKPPVTPKKWIHMVKKYFQQACTSCISTFITFAMYHNLESTEHRVKTPVPFHLFGSLPWCCC